MPKWSIMWQQHFKGKIALSRKCCKRVSENNTRRDSNLLNKQKSMQLECVSEEIEALGIKAQFYKGYKSFLIFGI